MKKVLFWHNPLFKWVFVCFLGIFLESCQTVPFKSSEDVSLKIAISSNSFSVSAFAFIKSENVRVDILKPFSGPFGYLYMKGEEAVFLFPSFKKYYRGEFKNTGILPQIENLSAKWFVAILKGEMPKRENCMAQGRVIYCKLDKLEVFLKKQDSRRTFVTLKVSNQDPIKIKVRRLNRNFLEEKIFSYSLKGYQPIEKWGELEF